MRTIIALVLVSLVFSTAKGQTHQIDSLLKLLPHVSKAADKADVYYELAYEYIILDVELALKYSKLSYFESGKVGDSLRMVKAGRLLTSAYRRLDKIDSSIITARNVLNISIRNNYPGEIKILFNSLAMAYSLKAEYDRALDYHFKSLVLREEDGNKSEISITLNNIGFVYFKLKNYEKAIDYFNRSLELKKEINDTWDLDRVYLNIGLCNIQLMNFNEALESIKKGLAICGSNCSDEVLMEGVYALGVANYGLDRNAEAEMHFNQSLEMARRLDNKRFQAENLVYLGRVTLKSNLFEKTSEYLLDAESIVTKLGYNQLRIDIYREFANLYNLSEDYQNASFYQNKYIALKDSIIGEELVKNISKIQTQFEERENIATILHKEEALARQRMLNFSIGIIAVLAALLVFVLYKSNRIKQRVNAELSEAKGIIEEQNHELQTHADNLQHDVDKATIDLQIANRSLKEVNEELDHFIYKISHDIRGPLASLMGLCDIALIDVKDEMALDYLNKLDTTANKLNRILTRLLIVNQINSAKLNPERLDVNKILDSIILLETKKGVPPRFVFKRDIPADLNFRSDHELVRIILENLVDNAVKFHNNSSRVEPFVLVQASANGNTVYLNVIDNGEGIAEGNPDKIFKMFSRGSEHSDTGGLGLHLSKRATQRLGGEINLKRSDEGYTIFEVKLPLEIPVELESQDEV
jgi:signal transduction histidine kinase